MGSDRWQEYFDAYAEAQGDGGGANYGFAAVASNIVPHDMAGAGAGAGGEAVSGLHQGGAFMTMTSTTIAKRIRTSRGCREALAGSWSWIRTIILGTITRLTPTKTGRERFSFTRLTSRTSGRKRSLYLYLHCKHLSKLYIGLLSRCLHYCT